MKLFNEVNWYGRAMGRYASFSGRAIRSEYWYFALISFLLGAGAALLDRRLQTESTFYLLVTLVHAIPSLSVLVRRLHDTDRTGWWVLAAFTLIGAIPLLAFVCQRGTPAANRFGAALDGKGRPVPVAALPELTTAPSPARDPIGEVERLAELRAKGAISDAEFERMKATVFDAAGSTGNALQA
ncbi:DUF805 domain-containing protein [Lichenihabitans sp. Uapishka_5]|uniref:DUF805 domain-containing protein n=1 Tax=Lichenihabitans sp. Uapishka_5 TaxID=3037302 RepID=UPI0029E828FA|nr:DUF805 domain-containing protein [Lichenihabitans sp. Uapishka_5]MDX7950319.1 DUF805 domain-containing protein [Lichenihabitans sp. Uapishka_5]